MTTLRTPATTGTADPAPRHRHMPTRGPSTPGASGAAWHTAAAEELAGAGRWEQAYQHLRTAVRLLNGQSSVDELDRLRREHAEAREQSRRDSLTATYNRRYLDERLVALLGDPASVGVAGIGVALLDVDHFKQVNDSYGHPFGDRVLQRLVAVLDAGLPEGAFCARYGGEEFALVLPGHDRNEAVRVSEAARERVDRHPWQELAPGLRVTVSIGVAHGSGPVTGIEGLVGTADGLLYAAKNAGRNAVAYRDAHTGLVRLAGPAGGRRSIPQPPVVAPHWVPGAAAP
ncbi:GGDEF domain-containing protein [Pseudonocardia kunmingensis]|uniref:Diguanylate cyclase (GGDEF)-like protein n=1 Tax=Pseudonocardia kunmingensis TaxID=630975 RepID=A0A543DAM1_9PSEU|nr:GGDEF domain-containing protein [Pseudonocardia kunmingensis]TQM06328.1 diguanylate cyclase (GGDEF)-like protein [Pseudonocardia kunmingensis]